jgi:ADP-heptose:LPS heptosyltransferase
MCSKKIGTMKINIRCRFFQGDKPCVFYKKEGSLCTCGHFESIGLRILIIKARGIGDVIRTTPLLERLKKDYPVSHISWLTESPDILPETVDEPIKFDNKNTPKVICQKYDLLLNFDTDYDSCAVASVVNAKVKKGFILKNGKCAPANKNATAKFMLGLNDELSRGSHQSYPEQIFNIAGFKFNKERYRMSFSFDKNKKLIGLNTCCGDRWRTRLWSEERWIELARLLKNNNYEVLLLGGDNSEHGRNIRISRYSGALYFGFLPLKSFITLMGFCDVIVTSVTMAMHVAIALGKKIVVLNNVFNKNEFELYGLGTVLEPNVNCLGCYKDRCKKQCMDLINPQDVVNSIIAFSRQGKNRSDILSNVK